MNKCLICGYEIPAGIAQLLISVSGNKVDSVCISHEGSKELKDLITLRLINSMEVIEFSADGEEIEYILVDDNEGNREILHKIGMSDEEIETECYPEDGELDLVVVGFKYANMWWEGKGFYNK